MSKKPTNVMAVMENLAGHGYGHFWTDDDLQTEAIDATIAMNSFIEAVQSEAAHTSDESTRKALFTALSNIAANP